MSDLLQQAHHHRLGGEYGEAEALYRRIMAEEGDCAEACWGLGHTLMNQGDFDACAEFFERATELEPANALYVLDLAKFLAMVGEDDRAKELYNRVVAIGGNEKCVSEAKKQLTYY
jgi:tetratricopeptide (TPR) repeat protein